jgi:hypothetical protein
MDRVSLHPTCPLWTDATWLGKGSDKHKKTFTLASVFVHGDCLEVLLFSHTTKLLRATAPGWIINVFKHKCSAVLVLL